MATVPRPLYVLSCDVECCHSVCEFYWGVTFVRVISRLLQCPSVFYRNIDSMEKQQPLPNHRVYKLVLTGGKQPGKRYCGKFARALSISMKINKNTCLPPLKTNEWLPPYHITSGTRLNLRVINCIRILSTWHGDSLISDPWSINQPSTSWLQIIAMSPISCIQLTDSSREDDVVVGSGLDRGAGVPSGFVFLERPPVTAHRLFCCPIRFYTSSPILLGSGSLADLRNDDHTRIN